MNRPWQIWIGFVAALMVVAAGVGWLSFRALESDRAEAAARRQAALEEDVRVALWRMDSLMSTFVAQESARGADAWQPFGFNTQSDNSRNRGRRLAVEPLASPLLARPSPQVLIYFERSAAGDLTSPQVPRGPLRERAVPAVVSSEQVDEYERRLHRLRSLVNFDELLAFLPPLDNNTNADLTGGNFNNGRQGVGNNSGEPSPGNGLLPGAGQGTALNSAPFNGSQLNKDNAAYTSLPEQQEKRQQALGVNDFRRRSNYVAQSQTLAQSASSAANPFDLPDESVLAATMTPHVVAGELLLARTVCTQGKTLLQGCWIDWGLLRGSLLAEIADLLPQANLLLVDRPSEGDQTR